MKNFKNIINELNSSLEKLESETEESINKAEQGIQISKNALIELRTISIERTFKNQEDEIFLFKHIKPIVYSKLIYYVKLFNIESKRPRGSAKSQKKYLDYKIKRLQDYFNDNLEFYQYYRRGGTSLDSQYFVRGKNDIRLQPDNFHFLIDDKFSTSHDSTVATIMAYDMLIVYLQKEMELIENKNGMETTINPFQKQSKLFWTGNKVDLIELIYALHASGAINSGTADIKEMAIACEQAFNIDLGNYYHTFVEIRTRKMNKIKFMMKLNESLEKRLEESD